MNNGLDFRPTMALQTADEKNKWNGLRVRVGIAYGICDNDARRKIILDAIETQMQKEKLFFWPLAMSSYAEGEGRDMQFPFPVYENGDLFLSWGALQMAITSRSI